MERICRECGAPLTGRADKCFCSDGCRTAWHNRRYCEQKRPTVTVNGILRRNRALLEAIYTLGVCRIRLSDSRITGYDAHYFTAVERTPLHRPRYRLYEFSFDLRGGWICRLRKEPRAAI